MGSLGDLLDRDEWGCEALDDRERLERLAGVVFRDTWACDHLRSDPLLL